VEGNSPAARHEALTFLKGIEQHVATEGCLGHVSEIFDGVAPHAPRGCFAQAWSLGEILYALRQILEGSSGG
jgi:glycogen debranching enzyme